MKTENTKTEFLKKNVLKPTSQRILLSQILFSGKDMHFCAEDIKKIIENKGLKMSLATIYNNLNHFFNHLLDKHLSSFHHHIHKPTIRRFQKHRRTRAMLYP